MSLKTWREAETTQTFSGLTSQCARPLSCKKASAWSSCAESVARVEVEKYSSRLPVECR